jgi:hypothetical protein
MSLIHNWVSVEPVVHEIKKLIKTFVYGSVVGAGLMYYGSHVTLESKYESKYKERLQSMYEKNKHVFSKEQQVLTLEDLLE